VSALEVGYCLIQHQIGNFPVILFDGVFEALQPA
jgi:hypothetical protein